MGQKQDTAEAPQSSAALMHVRENGEIVFGNQRSAALFPGIELAGNTCKQVLEEAEKFGLLSVETAARVDTALRMRQQAHLFEMRDGRSFLLAINSLASGHLCLEFTDVSYAIQVTLSQQRDVLTGLPNRLELLRRLQELTELPATKNRIALLYVDLDRFKAVNDTLGHPVGDALLKLVAERMSRLLGSDDLLVRLGGDEFVILQSDRNPLQAAEALASRLIEIVSRTYLVQGHSVQVGASIGIALGTSDGRTPEELIKNADLALFKAKASGRATFRFFTDAMDRELQARRAMEIDLRRALAMQEFSLVYQPQFQVDGTRLVGFEALVRWSTPARGHVSPAEFIPVAEEIGLIEPLGEWILRQACAEAARWSGLLSVSVNLSPLQFKNPRLVSTVVSALANAGLSPSRLDLEITEGALIDDTENVLSALTQMKDLGIKVSIDDFGTGYSSLSYLQKFPFDKIKIDQSFIRSLDTSADSVAIVRAVTALGESLGMMTIAEGVETESQLQQIAREGCRQVQGYLTGRPLSPSDAFALTEMKL